MVLDAADQLDQISIYERYLIEMEEYEPLHQLLLLFLLLLSPLIHTTCNKRFSGME
jgi:hypothetical protein